MDDKLNNWQLKPSGTKGHRSDEATLCGGDTDRFSPKTTECIPQPGRHFVGDGMYVTGHLGG